MNNTAVLEFHCGLDCVIEQYSGSGFLLWTELCYRAIQRLFWCCIVNCLSNTEVLVFDFELDCVIEQHSGFGFP